MAKSLVCFAEGDTATAVAFLASAGDVAAEPAARQRALEEWWNRTPHVEKVERSVAQRKAPRRTAAATAQKYLEQKRLHTFVEESKVSLDIAPVSHVVVSVVPKWEPCREESGRCFMPTRMLLES